MRNFCLFIILASLCRTSTAPAAIVPATASITLKSLLLSRGSVIVGPFTIDDFSLQAESANGTWWPASSSVAAALLVRPITTSPLGIEISGSGVSGSVLSNLRGLELSYRLTSRIELDSATVSLHAASAGGSAGFSDQLSVTPVSFSPLPSQADTQWSSVSSASDAGLSAQVLFQPAMVLRVSDKSVFKPGSATVVAVAVDNVFVPEPGAMSALVPLWLLLRRRACL